MACGSLALVGMAGRLEAGVLAVLPVTGNISPPSIQTVLSG